MATREAASDAQSPRLARGFTLVEIAVVLVIIALALGALLPLLSAQAANARISATRAHQDAIKAALITYLGRHGYLPCPADGYAARSDAGFGHEARSADHFALPDRSCNLLATGKTPATSRDYSPSGNAAIPDVAVYRGVLPWLDLGLSEDVVNDGWNQRISYLVTSLGVTGYATRDAASGLLGGLVVCSDIGTTTPAARLLTPVEGVTDTVCSSPATTLPLVSMQSAAVALVSHGENGYGAFMPPPASGAGTVKAYDRASAEEVANIDVGRRVLVQAGYSRSFDDVVMWLTPADLTMPLIQSGALPSVQGLLNARLAQARQAILSSVWSTATTQWVSGSYSGGTTSGYQLYLCLPLQDNSLRPLFYTQYSTSVGGQLRVAALPAGATASGQWENWAFSYEGANDIAQGGAARDPSKSSQVNYDPWGNPLLYTQTLVATGSPQFTVFTQTDPATSSVQRPYAFILYSVGPDGVLNTADDASLGVTVAEVRTVLQQSMALVASAQSPSQHCPAIAANGGG